MLFWLGFLTLAVVGLSVALAITVTDLQDRISAVDTLGSNSTSSTASAALLDRRLANAGTSAATDSEGQITTSSQYGVSGLWAWTWGGALPVDVQQANTVVKFSGYVDPAEIKANDGGAWATMKGKATAENKWFSIGGSSAPGRFTAASMASLMGALGSASALRTALGDTFNGIAMDVESANWQSWTAADVNGNSLQKVAQQAKSIGLAVIGVFPGWTFPPDFAIDDVTALSPMLYSSGVPPDFEPDSTAIANFKAVVATASHVVQVLPSVTCAEDYAHMLGKAEYPATQGFVQWFNGAGCPVCATCFPG